MRFPRLFLIIALAVSVASCSTSKKGTSHKTKEIACSDLQLPAGPHIDWFEEKQRVLNGYHDTKLPDYYDVYSIDSQQLHNFFTAVNDNTDDNAAFTTIVPVPQPMGCQVFHVIAQRAKMQGFHTGQSTNISLDGKDVSTGKYELNISYDGKKMSGSVAYNNAVYTIVPVFYNNHIYYILYQLPVVRISKQMIAPNTQQNNQMLKSSSGR